MTTSAPQSLALALGIGSLVLLIAHRLRIPSVLPLLLTGILLGRSGAGVLDADTIGTGLKALITVSIALLIFEGSLHLDRKTLSAAPKAVWRILTIGALVTWAGAAVLARLTLDMPWGVALVLGAILIVTGPTVIQPIIRRVPLTPRLSAVLASEGIIIDAIGAVAAISTLEVIIDLAGAQTGATTFTAALSIAGHTALRLVGGGVIGAIAGIAGAALMQRANSHGRQSQEHLHLIAMAACMCSVGIGEIVAPESGLAAATVCGLAIASRRIIGERELRRFKEEIASFLLAVLFLLLASRFELRRLADAGWPEVLFLLGLIFVVRPMNILASTTGSSLSMRERFFAGLFAPRGVVAASVTSFAAIELTAAGVPGAERLEPVMFLVIAVTASVASVTARPLARALGVLAPPPDAVVIVGAHTLGRRLAAALAAEGASVRLVDSNPARIAAAAATGLPTALGDATDTRWLDEEGAPHDAGWVVAMTGNRDVDTVVARWGAQRCGPSRSFRFADSPTPADDRPGQPFIAGRPLAHLLDALEAGVLHITATDGPSPDPTATPLAFRAGGHTHLIPHNASPSIPPKARVINLTPNAPAPTVSPTGATDGAATPSTSIGAV